MPDTFDQLFVNIKAWLVGLAPEQWQWLVSPIISVAALIGTFAGLFALTTLIERKGLGRIQNRYGPNRVGPFGILQPVADGIKAMTKEDVVPRAADKIVHFIAPFVLVVPAFMTLAVIPIGRNMAAIDMDSGVLYFFAVGACTEMAVFMAGWSSRNKYSLLGAMRGIAQMVSYEVPLILSTVTVIMIVGSLSLVNIVNAQDGYSWILPHWFLLTPWGFAGFILFMIAATAESNRSPFDLPEGESEIIAGYYVEYSGFKFALFFLGEYIGMFAVCGMAITLFLGGWTAPFSFLTWVPSYLWFFIKLFCLVALLIWIRGTLPRLRIDQLMNFAWKFMLPMALLNLFVAAIWHFMLPGFFRWAICLVCLAGAYAALGNSLTAKRGVAKRVYKFAD